MSYEIYREIAEEEYFGQEASACLDKLQEEAENRHKRLFNRGQRDGRKQQPPQSPDDYTYWQGYCFGLRKYWLKQLNLFIPQEF